MSTKSPEEKQNSFHHILQSFGEKTSMTGMSYIYGCKRWYSKLLWASLLLLAWVVMLIHLESLFVKFYSFPKQTKVYLGFSTLEFPAITICNINAIKRSKLYMASEDLKMYSVFLDPTRLTGDDPYYYNFDYDFYDYFERPLTSTEFPRTEKLPPIILENATSVNPNPGSDQNSSTDSSGEYLQNKTREKRFLDFFDYINSSMFGDYYYDYSDAYLSVYNDYYYDMDYYLNTPMDNQYLSEKEFRDIYINESSETKHMMGHQIEDMMISCSFGGKACYPENFSLYPTAEYGNCYTLQSDKFISRKSGPLGGLSIILNIESGEYIESFTSGKGLRLVVHEKNTVPFPFEDGVLIPSAFETHMGLRMYEVHRLGDPHGKCENGDEMRSALGIQYTRQTCQVLCLQTSIMKECDCYQESQKAYVSIFKATASRPCRSKMEIACMVKTSNSVFDNEECVCLNPCNENFYTKTLSSHHWPTYNYAEFLADQICQDKPQTCDGLYNMEDWRDISLNFVKILVYFEDLNYEQIVEEEEITTTQFLSDVGGAIGMWIGLCLLGIFEVAQLLLEIALHAHDFCLHYGRTDRRDSKKRHDDLESVGSIARSKSVNKHGIPTTVFVTETS